jgi:hypothetical protein
MIAVAVVGLLLGAAIGGWRLKWRRDYCLRQASSYADMETYFRSMEASVVSSAPPQRLSIITDGNTYQGDKIAAYYAELKRLYLLAASRPWLSVPPDHPKDEIIILEPLSKAKVLEKTKGIQLRAGNSPGS